MFKAYVAYNVIWIIDFCFCVVLVIFHFYKFKSLLLFRLELYKSNWYFLFYPFIAVSQHEVGNKNFLNFPIFSLSLYIFSKQVQEIDHEIIARKTIRFWFSKILEANYNAGIALLVYNAKILANSIIKVWYFAHLNRVRW